MKKTIVSMVVAGLASLVMTASSMAHLPRTCSSALPARAELACATRNLHHAQSTLHWLKLYRFRHLAVVLPATTSLKLAVIERNHAWLAKASELRVKEAERRLSYNLPETDDWGTAVQIVQRVFPGSGDWLISCSSSEGGHGAWVWNTSGSQAGGWMQYMSGTFDHDYNRASEAARKLGFVIPTSANSWRSALGQALAGGWAYYNDRPAGKWMGATC